jgi:P27 family predicted phage terminase small subunit
LVQPDIHHPIVRDAATFQSLGRSALMAGRRPKPTHLKLLQGNPGKRPINAHEPKPPLEILPVPAELSGRAKEEWERMAQPLAQLGLLSSIDGAAFAAYCTLAARWRDAEDALKKTGPVVKSPSGYPMLSPYYTIANQSLSQMRAYLTEFGMTPSARSRLAVRNAEPNDALETFLYG